MRPFEPILFASVPSTNLPSVPARAYFGAPSRSHPGSAPAEHVNFESSKPRRSIHDRRDRAKDRAHAIGLGEPDPSARRHDADLGRPFDRRPVGGRPDRADDADPPAVGGGAHSHSHHRPPFAAAGLAGVARALGLSRHHGRLPDTRPSTRSSMSPRIIRARSISRSSRAPSLRLFSSGPGFSSGFGSPRCRRLALSSP